MYTPILAILLIKKDQKLQTLQFFNIGHNFGSIDISCVYLVGRAFQIYKKAWPLL